MTKTQIIIFKLTARGGVRFPVDAPDTRAAAASDTIRRTRRVAVQGEEVSPVVEGTVFAMRDVQCGCENSGAGLGAVQPSIVAAAVLSNVAPVAAIRVLNPLVAVKIRSAAVHAALSNV